MKRKQAIPVFVGEDSVRGLQEIVRVLNEGKKANPRMTAANHQRFLRLVRAWKDSGPDWSKMKVPLHDNVQLHDIKRAFDWVLSPIGNGRVYVSLSPTGPNFRDVVAVYFGRLILNPLCYKLGGPCLKCGRYYIKQTSRDRVYCSRKCAGGAVQNRRREKQHADKLARAMRAIRNYRSRPARFVGLEWRGWVVQAEPDISPKFLTRAVRKGELRPPGGEKLTPA